VELSWEEVRHVMEGVGFVVEAHMTDVPAHYTLNSRSLMRTEYRAVSFTARRI